MPDRDDSILAIEGVEAGYFPDVPILNRVGVSIRPREIVTIVGPNGAGQVHAGEGRDRAAVALGGSVRLRGEDVTGKKPHAIVARGVGYVAQRDNVFATMSVEENLELGALVLRSADPEARLGEMLDLFPRLGERRRQAAGTLSGGERQMLALARALMAGPELLLLDEPSAGSVAHRRRPDLREDRRDQRGRDRDPDGGAERSPGARDVAPRLRAGQGQNRFEGSGRDLSTTPRSSTCTSAGRASRRRTTLSDPARRGVGRPAPRA